jgi:hypothetical protein
MKIVKKTILPPDEIVYSPISAETTVPYEIIDTFNDVLDIPEPFATDIPDTFEFEEDTVDTGGVPAITGPDGATTQIVYGDIFWDTENPTTASNLEGVPSGSTFAIGTSSIDILKSILYPKFLGFDSFSIGLPLGPYQVGQTSAAGTYEASWFINDIEQAQENSIVIKQGSNVLISDFPLSYIEGVSENNVDIDHPPYSLTFEGNVTFTISLTGNDGSSETASQSLRWNYPLYTGKLSTSTLSSGDLSSLTKFINYTKAQMKSGITRDYSASVSPEYLYWVVPKSVNSVSIVDFPQYSLNASFTDITNPNTTLTIPVIKQTPSISKTEYGLTIEFDVYRTNVAFTASRRVRVAE